MGTTTSYKPIGGVESCTLYPADAVVAALFSSRGCEVELYGTPTEVALLDDASHYEESLENESGVVKVRHTLNLVADASLAQEWLEPRFLERCATEGVVAEVRLTSGRHILVGYSATFLNEQPLRLETLISTSGKSPKDHPTVTLRLLSHDTTLSCEIL